MSKKSFQKKKEREKKSKEKVLKIRECLRKDRKELEEKENLERQILKQENKREPIKKLPPEVENFTEEDAIKIKLLEHEEYLAEYLEEQKKNLDTNTNL